MKDKVLLAALLVPALLLLVPFTAMRFTAEVAWTTSDFILAYLLLAGAGLTFWVVNKAANGWAYRLGAGAAVFGGLSLIWVNLAVGFIGSEDNPANLLYAAVLAVLGFGSALARLRPAGMVRVLQTAAAVQFAVPVVAYVLWRPNFDANVALIFGLNACWVLLFGVGAVLFRAAREVEVNRA